MNHGSMRCKEHHIEQSSQGLKVLTVKEENEMAISIIITALIIIGCTIGTLKEDKLIEWEDRIIASIRAHWKK